MGLPEQRDIIPRCLKSWNVRLLSRLTHIFTSDETDLVAVNRSLLYIMEDSDELNKIDREIRKLERRKAQLTKLLPIGGKVTQV